MTAALDITALDEVSRAGSGMARQPSLTASELRDITSRANGLPLAQHWGRRRRQWEAHQARMSALLVAHVDAYLGVAR
jgi:hypothetical protein